MLFFQTPMQIGGLIALILVCGWAIWRGAPAVRATAIGVILASVATPIVQNWHDWSGPQWGIFWVDSALLVFLLYLGLRRNLWWTRLAVAAQLLTVLSHVSLALAPDPAVLARAYAITTYLLFFVLLGAIVWGMREEPRSPKAAPEPGP